MMLRKDERGTAMKLFAKGRWLALVLCGLLLAGCAPAEGTAEAAREPVPTDTAASAENGESVLTENNLGSVDGYDYELWKDRGDTSMTLNGEGLFSCEWENINNALFRVGRKFDCTEAWEEIGEISVNYGVHYFPVGNSYLCVYGWSRDPLVEYYVVESWGNWRPPGAESLGIITVGDARYDVYCTTRTDQPSIDGTQTFQQFWSVRKGKSTEGTVLLSEHFRAWRDLGLELGSLYETALTVEGYQSSGQADVYRNEIIIDAPPDAASETAGQRILTE